MPLVGFKEVVLSPLGKANDCKMDDVPSSKGFFIFNVECLVFPDNRSTQMTSEILTC